jgi:hypothetical protein
VTGLTGADHRSDRCGIGSELCKFLLRVLVCFGSEGCVLVPRFSGTPDVGLANLGSESESCLGSRVRFVGVFISFEKNFYRLQFTPPPSLVRRIGPSPGEALGPQSSTWGASSVSMALASSASYPSSRESTNASFEGSSSMGSPPAELEGAPVGSS